MSKECGTCMWYNGDFRDACSFCDDREEYVARYNWCPKYREDEYKVELKEEIAKNHE